MAVVMTSSLDKARFVNHLPKVGEFGVASDTFDTPSEVRGIRNNNWGNIETGQRWKGIDYESQPNDERFITFKNPIYSLRAITRITRNYNGRYGINTVEQWVNRWAPSHENNVEAYRDFIVAQTGCNQLDIWNYEYMKTFVKAVCQMECGFEINNYWNDWFYDMAYHEAV